MKKKFIFIILLWSNYVLFPQEHFHCIIDENENNRETSIDIDPKYGHIKSYIPDMDSTLPFHNPPIKTIKVNIHVAQKDDGSGNFQNNEDTRSRFRQIFEWINGFYSGYEPSDPIGWVEELPSYDSRIRFSIGEDGDERIYFYKNTEFWNPDNTYSSFRNYIINNYPENKDAINVLVRGNPGFEIGYAAANFPSWNDFDEDKTVRCYFWRPVSDYAVANLLGHEFGHNLDMMHTYFGGGASAVCDINHDEFIKDVFMIDTVTQECNCPHIMDWEADADSINGDGITNNLMGGNQAQHYISPLQAGMMHRSLSLTSVRKYVTCEKSDIPLVITEDEIWDFNIKLYRDLIIESNVTLTITDHLVMLPNAKIVVKPGGKLVVDGATITTDIYETQLWQGIEVWGVEGLSRNATNVQYQQGYLELKNGATIENAVCAVKLWNPSDNDSEGGTVYATDAVFRNNAKAVHAINYMDYNQTIGFETYHKASFENCTFVIDSDYIGEEIFSEHVELNNVKRINFYGCSFSADSAVSQVSSVSHGIKAIDASFNVSSYCSSTDFIICPEEYLIRNSFSGFGSAIYVSNAGQNTMSFSVEYSDFSNNTKGIFAQNIGYATITDNNFYVGTDDDCSFGLDLVGVSNFKVEKNTFSGNEAYDSDNYGIVVRNSASYNDIYLNTFSNLYCGNVAIGRNYVSSTSGLTYTCNTNYSNVNDFCIFKDASANGISACQGSVSMPAGNTFSGSNYHIYNNGNNIKYYCYRDDPQQIPNALKIYNVNAIATNNLNRCTTDNGTIDVMQTEDISALENKYNAALTAYNTLQLNNQGSETSEDIEAQLSQLKTEYLNIIGEIVKFHLQQEETDYEELREWLVKSEDIFADRMVVASFIQEGNYDDAKAYAEMIAKIYNLEGDDLKDHNDYLKLVDLYIDLHETDRSTIQLTDAELTMVKNIADNGIGTSQMMAETIMTSNGTPAVIPSCLSMSQMEPGAPSIRGEVNSDFAPIGTKWHYGSHAGFWRGGYVLIESVSDTIIDDVACKKLVKSRNYYNKTEEEVQRIIGYEYMTQINDSVMIYRYGKFMKLYDLGAEIGDTLVFPGTYFDFVGGDSLQMYGYGVVVGKGTIELDGQSLRYIDLEQSDDHEECPWIFSCYVDYNNDYYKSVRICEKIGNISGYLLPEAQYVADAEEGAPIRCYSDDVMSVSFQDVDCDYIDDTNIEENNHSGISIFPNPVDDNITISLTEGYSSIEIYDSFGRMMMSRQVDETTGQQVINVDISSYPSGLYLVVVKNDTGRYYKRIVKN